MAEPLWDIRRTAHRTGLLVLVALYLALLAIILYGHWTGRAAPHRDLPATFLR
jgi:hypothetical protein